MDPRPPDPYARLRLRRILVRVAWVVAVGLAGWRLWPGNGETEGLGGSIDAIVREAMEKGPIAGVSVGVARGGQTIYEAGYGWADLENQVPATSQTVYNVGSITKQFTAAAILQLVDEGRVSLEAPITRYLPELPGETDGITVSSLLNHTGGVHNFTTMDSWWRTVGVEMTPEEMVAVFADEPLDFAPGTAFSYSNSGYVLLGLIVEQAGGQPYGGYLNEHLFTPLSLSATSYCDDRALVPNRARGYQLEGSDFTNATHVSMSQAYAAGGLCSNVDDLLRWVRLLSGGGVVRRESYQRMSEPTTLPGGQRLEYGFGLTRGYLDGHARISHTGGMRGFASYLSHYPDDDLSIAVLSNTEDASAADIENRIARVLLSLGMQTTQDIPLSALELAAYTGRYDMTIAGVSLVVRDARLRAVIGVPGIDDTDLLYQGDDTFQAEGDPQTWLKFRMEGDTAVGFDLVHDGIALEGRRTGSGGP